MLEGNFDMLQFGLWSFNDCMWGNIDFQTNFAPLLFSWSPAMAFESTAIKGSIAHSYHSHAIVIPSELLSFDVKGAWDQAPGLSFWR